MMTTLLDFENAVLDLFENNRITIEGAKTVLWTLFAAIYEDELIEEPHRRETIISNIERQKELLLVNILGESEMTVKSLPLIKYQVYDDNRERRKMNVKDILSTGEEILFKGQQHRFVPGGKEITPGQIFVTNQRVILETSSMLGIKKEYQDLHYRDIMSIKLEKNVFSSKIILQSRFQGEIHITSLGKKEAQEIEQIINQKTSQEPPSDTGYRK